MPSSTAPNSWFGPPSGDGNTQEATAQRVWQGFLTARMMMALAILLLQGLAHILSTPLSAWSLALSTGYTALTVAARLLAAHKPPPNRLGLHWLPTIGLDLVVFSAMQLLQAGNMNYTPLLAVPVLMAAALAARTVMLGAAALATALLLVQAWVTHNPATGDAVRQLLQATVTGTGYFLLGLLVHQLAQRLAREEQASQSSRMAAKVQAQVNALVIDQLTDGLLVIDSQDTIRAINPAAQRLLGAPSPAPGITQTLGSAVAWTPLHALVADTFASGDEVARDISLTLPDQTVVQLHARTRLTSQPALPASGNLCVMYLHDLREMQAQLRTEKLAAMGRMSAALAHEIRNPLAAITQANALLGEELSDPAQLQLIRMVEQNSRRLARLVEEVLDIARIQRADNHPPSPAIDLNLTIAQICREWLDQGDQTRQMRVALADTPVCCAFDAEHLRRILINLLDNALRYATAHPDAIQVSTRTLPDNQVLLQVWSDGAPLEKSVQRHLFEPFFSSESRSSGLGLYICRQLCERHGAQMGYLRITATTQRGELEGNAFYLNLRGAAPQTTGHPEP